MENASIIVVARNDYYELEVDQQKNRVYITLSGYWDNASGVREFINHVRTCTQKLNITTA